MPLQVGVIGCGSIAHAHIPAIQAAPEVEIAGVFDRDPARSAALASQHGIGIVYGSWDELLRDDEVDVVAVLLPHQAHHDIAIAALEAGKHVMCEKPLATTLAECDAMIAAARRAGRALMPCHTRLYEPATAYLSDLLSRRALGDIYLVQTAGIEPPSTVALRPWLGAAPGDGVLMAQAIHVAYLLRYLVGEIVEVQCLAGGVPVVEMVAEDTAVVLARFASGAVAQMTATFGQRIGPTEHVVTLHGRDGWASYQARGDRRRLRVASPAEFRDDQTHTIELSQGPHFHAMWSAFGRAVRAGQAPPVTGEDGRAAVEVILAAYQSAAAGQPARLPLGE